MTNVDANVGNGEQWFTPYGNTNSYNYYGNWCASCLKRKKEAYNMLQLYYFLVNTCTL